MTAQFLETHCVRNVSVYISVHCRKYFQM